MQNHRERWMELCAQAADEKDPKKLMVLVREIAQLLEAKERRLMSTQSTSAQATDSGS